MLTQIGEGFHSLQLYANAFWLEHLLEYAVVRGSVNSHHLNPLAKQLSLLCEMHASIVGSKDNPEDITTMLLPADPRLQSLDQCGSIFALASCTSQYRQELRQRQQRAKGKYLLRIMRVECISEHSFLVNFSLSSL
jgi:hypothetical protein